jgi:hypothetical protein
MRPESPELVDRGTEIVAAIQARAERTGEPPTAREWKRPPPTVNSRPTTRRVIRVFGSGSGGHRGCGVHSAPPGEAAPQGTAVGVDYRQPAE